MTDCILTTKDFTILEVMLERGAGHPTPLTALLKAKIATARVVFREDVPETVATLNSRVSFRVDDGAPQERIVSQARIAAPTGNFQPITTLRGLALLGLAEGECIHAPGPDGQPEEIVLLKVLHQPETAQRRMNRRSPAAPILKLVAGGKPLVAANSDLDDDPGPSAA